MAKITDKKITKEGQHSSRPPAKKYFKKLTNNISKDTVHPSSVPHNNPSENRALDPVTDNNATATNKKSEFSGYIFMCSKKTKPECYINRVFGLPFGRREVVEKIKPGTKLFLFDTDVKLLYGVYEASSNGGMNLEPTAFGGMFPAQVRFRIHKDALPLPLSSFRHAIKDNYRGSKFAPELNSQQVSALLSLFSPISARLSGERYPTAPNGVPEPRRIPATNNGWISTPLQNTYRQPMHNLPQQIMRPQNVVNPHLHNCHPAVTHQAPPPPGHRYQFTENLQPYPSYMAMHEMHPLDQGVGLDGGHRESVGNHVDGYFGHNPYPVPPPAYGSLQLRPTAPYDGPVYMHAPLTSSQSMPVSSYYSYAEGLRFTH
ncbi:hypothetical protein L2E82_27471 [Cichorium intybus]|uniref:Uncharacterized protein n=1 Tax=Cichorium intybus TaxID=13427 RepID=A0ACB9CT40_CICIN|nr:hypothetical protein L2E82_27471 [Cichorium intybus]